MEKIIKKMLKKIGLYKFFLKIYNWALPNNTKIPEYDEISQIYSKFITQGDTCFDVGANLGLITDVFLKLGAKVISIEPQTECIKVLREKFKDNNNVIIISKALSDHEGIEEISICEEAPTISTMSDKWKNRGRFSKNYEWSNTERIDVTTLDNLIEQYGMPKFCKIDVEGFETSVLKGLSRPIPYISFEFTREFIEDAKICISHIQSISPAKFNCTLHGLKDLLFPDWVSSDELFSRLEKEENDKFCGDIYAKLG